MLQVPSPVIYVYRYYTYMYLIPRVHVERARFIHNLDVGQLYFRVLNIYIIILYSYSSQPTPVLTVVCYELLLITIPVCSINICG